jgi:hypothetical protein
MRRTCWAAGLVVAVLCGAPKARAVDDKVLDKAVARGVAALKELQRGDGTWDRPNHMDRPERVGATALAGLTLLECGVSPDDKSVSRAADVVRRAGVRLRFTYGLALSILFLDRLGDPGDVRLIESMTLRLLAGQSPQGGWSYTCPDPGDDEARRLTELLGRREPPTEGRTAPKEEGRVKEQPKRTVKDLPPEIQNQLPLINRAVVANDGIGRDDNSNTQFAVLALWIGRRYGFPVEEALKRVDARFRTTQHGDGGWTYLPLHNEPGARHLDQSTATMTAAGLLALAVAHGVEAEMKDGKGRPDPAKDRNLKAGLVALGTAIGHPVGKKGGPVQLIGGGRAYYFLWSLERVAVALDLETIGGKNWYEWGAEVLLANQRPDGTWQAEYAQGGVDTCFALLFLRRANFARDLTSHFRGKLQDPGKAVLRAGGVGGDALTGSPPPPLKSALEPDKSGSSSATDPTPEAKGPRESVRPTPRTTEEAAVAKLSDELVRARPEKRKEVIDQLRDGKGTKFTEALADAIPQLSGDDKRKARDALADRLARMKADTLDRYLQDELPEIRRAAALACAMKEEKEHVPGLIDLLRDAEPAVVRAAHAALKELTHEDFGPGIGADKEEVAKAVEAWRAWWAKKK